jgi:very-short-patch-repair endonuclease
MQLAMAGVLDAPGIAYLSHRSAAAYWHLPGFYLRKPIQVVIPWQGTNGRTRLTEVHYHRGLPRDHLLTTDGIRVVSPALCIFLLAGTEHPARTERALDNGLSMRLFNVAILHQLLKALAARGRNGIRLMRSLLMDRPADYVPPQSGLEARVDRLARDVGVALRRQVDIGDEAWLGRVDFELEDSPDVIEVMSARFHSAFLDQEADRERFERLRESGRRLLVVWDADVWERPEVVRLQILAFWRDRTRL